MSEKMRTRSERGYRRFRQAQRDAHTVIVQVAAKDVPAPRAEWWADLRRGRLNILGGVLRKIDTLCMTGHADLGVALAEVVLAYAKDQADDSRGQAA